MLKMMMSALQGEEDRVVQQHQDSLSSTENEHQQFDPISSFRRLDEDNDEACSDENEQEILLEGEEKPANEKDALAASLSEQLMMPALSTIDNSNNSGNKKEESFVERLQREIDMAKAAARNVKAPLSSLPHPQIANDDNSLRSTTTNDGSYVNSLQRFAITDPIAKQRLLSFDESKDDIDYILSSKATPALDASLLEIGISMSEDKDGGDTDSLTKEDEDDDDNYSVSSASGEIRDLTPKRGPLHKENEDGATAAVSFSSPLQHRITVETPERTGTPMTFVKTKLVIQTDMIKDELSTRSNKSEGSAPSTATTLLRKSPEKWYRRSRIVLESDGNGEGIAVVADIRTPRDGDDEEEEEQEEKKENGSRHHRARFDFLDDDMRDCLSATESEVASVDGLPSTLQQRWMHGTREQMMKSLDGIPSNPRKTTSMDTMEGPFSPTTPSYHHGHWNPKMRSTIQNRLSDDDVVEDDQGTYFEPCFGFGLCGNKCEEDNFINKKESLVGACRPIKSWKEQHEVPLAIFDCANLIHQEDRVVAPPMQTSLVRVASDHPNPSYAETILPTEIDPRMQDWVSTQFEHRGKPPKDGSYHLGKSRTVVVHEINRGDWTWCTAWSPDGALLAVATENHHLAVIDTTSSTVWRVRHDRRVRSPTKSNTTQSIRAIAWGAEFIAVGGTGNAVSILSPKEPYQILHTIPGTGFVGSLNWKGDSNVLAIGSRLDFAMIFRINAVSDESSADEREIESEVLHRIDYKYWVNSIAFNPDGSCIALGDSGGVVSVYDYEETNEDVETNMITWFKRKDSILSVEWSPDGKWLYAGGEDRSVTVIDTTYWEIVHRIGRDRWVQCIASSNGGSHISVGGVSSEISILDVQNGWDSVMGIELKGLVPLSAKWHPKDQYLALTGQDSTILAVETTNARHVKGHHLHSISPVLSIEFSPDGRMVIIGNKAGVVTFYSLTGTTFITAYELIIPSQNGLCTQWSYNGMFIVIGTASTLMIIGRKRNKRQGKKCPPNASGFSVKKVVRDFGPTNAVAIDFQSQFVAVSGDSTRILDVRADFEPIREWTHGPYYANAWSPDGRRLAMIGQKQYLTIYDTGTKRVDKWRAIFTMKCNFVGRALAWGPLIVGGLMYLAYGGDSKDIYIMEIRTHEGTWETVLKIPRDGSINALDWSTDGLLAAGIGNGTVCIIDLAYLQSGIAVNEMDYNWQRQALTCFTEIRRNRGENSIKSLRWLPAAPGSDRLLAVGGTDGEVEIIDLTERRRCKGYVRGSR
jgi:WD40 repeat protein